MEFELHPRLAKGSISLGKRADCQILLKDNALFPWILIIPEVKVGIEDLHQLDSEQYISVMQLVREISIWLSKYTQADKLNVACIGNQVRQMHVHIVARFETDEAWPQTVWAHSGKKSYTADDAAMIANDFRKHFDEAFRPYLK